ncbi:MAG: hypothetical protein SVU32_06065 [Candidatus Nanohaloarchaea archaeon]|nr:hypothetical protein [Candidatus Nanohaloarchaea archaeon]
MERKEELKEAVERLSEQEFERLQLLKKIASIVEQADMGEINSMPTLYRLEIKKALEELGNQHAASRIKT